MRHVIKYADSKLVQDMNTLIKNKWRSANRQQRRGMLRDFLDCSVNPHETNRRLEWLIERWKTATLRTIADPPLRWNGREQLPDADLEEEKSLDADEPPPSLVIPPTYRPTPTYNYTKEYSSKDARFWRKLIKEQPRRSAGGPTGWRFSILQRMLETSVELLQELWLDFVTGEWPP